MDREKKNSGLGGVLKNLVKRLWIIFVFAAIGGAVMYLVTTQYIEPKYHASVRLYINSDGTSDDLVDVCGAVVKSQSVLEEIIAESGVNYSYEELEKMLVYHDINSTNMIEITVRSTNAEEAVAIADVIAFILPDKAEEVIFESKVTVLQYATLPTEPSEPSLGKNTLIGLSAGAILAIIFITIVYLLDDAIKDKEYLTKTFDIPVLAYIPDYALTKAEEKVEKEESEEAEKETEDEASSDAEEATDETEEKEGE
ncbi:MAG: hypothetical protein IKV39_04475 [Clostridia bacterium]|nr:hypothetical protein [Clostridia bacterium]